MTDKIIEFLTEIKEHQNSEILQVYFTSGIKKLRNSGYCIIPTKEKKPICKFETEEDKERANKTKIDLEAAMVMPESIAVIDVESPDFLGLKWEEIATVKTPKGYHVYIYREDWMRYLKTSDCELRVGNNLLVMLPGSRFYSEKYQSDVCYTVINPRILYFSELPLELQDWILKKTQETKMQVEETFETKKDGNDIVNLQKLKNLILQYYHEGNRQNIIIYLTGWLGKLGLSDEDILSLISEIAMEAGDKEIKMRIAGALHTLKKLKDGEEVKGIAGLIELGISKEDLLSCLEIKRDEELVVEGISQEKYVVLNNFIYKIKEDFIYPVGPFFQIIEKRIVKEKNHSYAKYLVKFRDQYALWDNVANFSEIERFTGLRIMNETLYKSWINAECMKAKELLVMKQTGWHDGLFLHPARNTEKHIFDENHILVRENRALYKNTAEHHEIVKNLLKEGKILGFLLVCSVASILQNYKPFIVFVSGPAATGKTLACSFATHLFYDSQDIIVTANSTQTAFELLIKSMKNLPVLLDEGALGKFNMEELTFMLSTGKGKARGTINLNTIISELSSVVFVTSEVSEAENFKRTGAFRRCVIVSVKDWNEFTEIYTMNEIRKGMKFFCGAGLDYIEMIEKFTDEDFENLENASETYIPIFTDQANIIKAVFSSLIFLENFYGEKFNALEEFILNFFTQAKEEYEEKEKDLVRKFRIKFGEFVTRNYYKFYNKNNPERVSEIFGKIEGQEIYILTHIFSDFCKENGFDNKILLQMLKERGILQTDEKRFCKVVKIAGQVTTVYHIVLPAEENNNITEEKLQIIENFINSNAPNQQYHYSVVPDTDIIKIEKYMIQESKEGPERKLLKLFTTPVRNLENLVKLIEILSESFIYVKEREELEYEFKLYNKLYTFKLQDPYMVAYALGALEFYQNLLLQEQQLQQPKTKTHLR